MLETRMQYYNDAGEEGLNAGLAGVQKVSDKLEKVKGVMVQNIEHILERGEKVRAAPTRACGLTSPVGGWLVGVSLARWTPS